MTRGRNALWSNSSTGDGQRGRSIYLKASLFRAIPIPDGLGKKGIFKLFCLKCQMSVFSEICTPCPRVSFSENVLSLNLNFALNNFEK